MYLCGRSRDHRAQGGDSQMLSSVHLSHQDTGDCSTISQQGLYLHILLIHSGSLHGELFLKIAVRNIIEIIGIVKLVSKTTSIKLGPVVQN